MALTVIGGSNFVGRYLIKSLSGSFSEVRLGDMYPFRQSVYRLQEELGDKIKKYPLSYPTNLKLILDGTEDLYIITHDYFKLAYSKYFYLERAVQYAQEYDIKKITLISPFELDQLNGRDGDPELLARQAEESARKVFPDLKSLKTDLIFGQNCTSLLIQKALEDLDSGKRAITYKNGQSWFAPVFEEDFLAAVKALKPGESQSIAGPYKLKWDALVKILADHIGKPNPSHTNLLDWIKGRSAVCDYTGDIFWPSQYQQLYRILNQNRNLEAQLKGSKKLEDFYQPGKFQGLQKLNWHRVILD